MMEGGERRVRGGQNLLAKLSEPAECEEDKRLLCVSYWRAVCSGGGGKGGRTGREEEGDAGGVLKVELHKRAIGDFADDT